MTQHPTYYTYILPNTPQLHKTRHVHTPKHTRLNERTRGNQRWVLDNMMWVTCRTTYLIHVGSTTLGVYQTSRVNQDVVRFYV